MSEESEIQPKHIKANNIFREIGVKHLVHYFERYRDSINFAHNFMKDLKDKSEI